MSNLDNMINIGPLLYHSDPTYEHYIDPADIDSIQSLKDGSGATGYKSYLQMGKSNYPTRFTPKSLIAELMVLVNPEQGTILKRTIWANETTQAIIEQGYSKKIKAYESELQAANNTIASLKDKIVLLIAEINGKG